MSEAYSSRRRTARQLALANRCAATHDPGIWPYTARCTKSVGHKSKEHRDRHGKLWLDEKKPE